MLLRVCICVKTKKSDRAEIFSFSRVVQKKGEKKRAKIFCLLKNNSNSNRHMREERDLVYFCIKST